MLSKYYNEIEKIRKRNVNKFNYYILSVNSSKLLSLAIDLAILTAPSSFMLLYL